MSSHYALNDDFDDEKLLQPITQNKQDIAPNDLSHMEKMAAIGQLSSSVAHEMRNLMGMIRTAAFNIDRALQSSDTTINNNLDVINRSVTRAREFIDNLLDLSCMPRGTVEPVDVRLLTDNLLNLFSKELEWRQIKLIRQYESVPPFYLDRNILQECLLNLILNAIQSMDSSGCISLQIVSWQAGLKIGVHDTGCGISQDKINKIFDRFYTTKQHNQGTGLGLTIAKSLAVELGGTIKVESTLHQGSSFYICLPDLNRAHVPENGKVKKIHSNQI